MDTAEPSRKPILIAVILGLILIAATTSICLLMKHGQISLSPETHKTDATSERAGDNPFASGSRSKQGTEDASSNAPTADDMKIVAAGGTGLTYKDSASHYILELPASWYGRSSVQKTLSMQDTNDLTIDESYYLDEIHLFTIRRTEREESGLTLLGTAGEYNIYFKPMPQLSKEAEEYILSRFKINDEAENSSTRTLPAYTPQEARVYPAS